MILEKNDKFTTVESVDQVVSAEIPDPVTNPRLYELVTKHMLHGPCGQIDPGCPCMEDGKCKADFPKQFQAQTNLNVDGFPLYRRTEAPPVTFLRRSKTAPFTWQQRQFDNRHVVPFNKYLLLRFNAHINVEVCTSVHSVKYIYKYIFKGFLYYNIYFFRHSTMYK